MIELKYDLTKYFISEARKEALNSTCLERRCGAVVVKDNAIVGRGFNSPPGNLESQRRCNHDKGSLHKKVTDKTCCVHAERRAIRNAIENCPHGIKGAVIYFTSVDDDGNRMLSKDIFCTDCSKEALDTKTAFWCLEQKEGFVFYNTEEYNDISYNYGKS